MKILNTTPVISTAALLIMALNTTTVSANLYPDYISGVALSVEGGIYPHAVVLENVSANKQLEALQLQAEKTHIDVDFQGHVSCAADNKVDFDNARAYFGPISLFLDSVQSPQTLFDAAYHPSFTTGKGNKRITEAGNFQSFNIPLAQIQQGHPAVRFNPEEELNKKLQQHLNQGGSKIDFYRQDQYISVNRTVSLAGWCKHTSNNTSRPAFASVPIEMTVIYKGDADLIAPVQLSAQLAQSELPGQVTHNLPFSLNSATFQPNMPHYIGKCTPDTDPVIRINYSGNGKGLIRFSVKDNTATVYGSPEIAYDSADGVNAHLDFSYPLIGKLNQENNSGWDAPNQTFSHPLSIRASIKDVNSDQWSEWKTYGSANWNHRCIPQVNVIPAGAQGGVYTGQQPSPTLPSPSRIQPVETQPKLDRVQPPATPEPGAPSRVQPRVIEEDPTVLQKR
ncbi:hypothetical protein LH51_17190 [Nitrincola sp. A-D6]|uniref:hypothetical protein n=1 Tax=Nitrincola sp. A-D6 TaxID=1545442 RepID=UPI00051FC895|nr:hypothetical protein [Nitrincola sp. A-D6]KGK41121.1 hypothetical protein LH51_17190 [Nitrincola sp. A-D6]